jgi:error-prone DNA polymerase
MRILVLAASMSSCPYVELHCHSGFSFLDGASHPDELAGAAAAQGHSALAITDHDGVWGAMEFAQAAKPLGVRPIVGAEVTIASPVPATKSRSERLRPAGSGNEPAPAGTGREAEDPGGGIYATNRRECFHLTLLVENVVGWRNLCLLLTEAHAGTRPAPGREALPPVLPLESLERRAEGIVCLSGCAREGALAGVFARAGGPPTGSAARSAEALGRRLLAAFGPDRFRVELQRPFWRHDLARNRWLAGLAGRLGVPCVATGNVHAHDPARAFLQDALAAIRLGASLDETEALRRGNRRAVLAPPDEMAARFAEHPDAVAETTRLAERLRFDLARDHGYRYPGAEDPDADRKLAELCAARFEGRYAGAAEPAEARRRLEEELRVIRKLRLSGFFLLHADLLELAREVACEVRGPESARSVLPPGRGRGSSVSSVVCYLTGLSHVDPVASGLFLGRFLNDEITEAPDIDLDFPRDIREQLIPRIHERYGHERSALVAAFPTFRVRGAVRDLGKALGLPPTEIERVARAVDAWAGEGFEADVAMAIGERRAKAPRWRALARLVRDAWGLPRHPSQHPGGMVLSTTPLTELCPVVPAAMEGRRIVQWDKDSCADAGFLKIDLLGLGMLSAVERCVDTVARTRGERLDLSRIPLDDEEVYGAIRRAETTGVFQIESRAQMQMLPRSLPENLDDLTVQVALVRPGPIQGGAVHPYLERRRLLREDPGYEIPYEHPALKPILSDTLGAIVFQDQVIQVAMALAGFGAGEAEGLRRAMSRKRSEEAINAYRERFLDGAVAKGVGREVAERVFEQIRGFSGFGFPKSHASAFGLLAYQSTWLRVHRGPEFLCALLNEQPMGFYPPDALVHEAQRRGIEVRGPDVNTSDVECTVELAARSSQLASESSSVSCQLPAASLTVRIGLGYVTGLREDDANAIVAERKRSGRYGGLGRLASRAGVRRDALERLAWAGACESIGVRGAPAEGRREALWRLGVAGEVGPGGQLTLPLDLPEAPELAKLGDWEQAVADYGSTGMTLGAHPLALMRPGLEGVATSADVAHLENGSVLEVAGIVVARQRPATARGVIFMLLEDEFGVVNIVVPPPVYASCRLAVRTAAFARVQGRLERQGKRVVNVVAARVAALATPDISLADVLPIEPSVERETGRERDAAGDVPDERVAAAAGALAAVAPQPHSFGRR